LGRAAKSHKTVLTDNAEVASEMMGEQRTDKELAVSNITNEFFNDDGIPISSEVETAANVVLDPVYWPTSWV
jgi:hypothetical protein